MEKMNKRTSRAFGKKVYLLGKDTHNKTVWLEEPVWDCGWYWGFGYVEIYTRNNPSVAIDIEMHTHWDSHIVGRIGGKYVYHINEHPYFKATTLTNSEAWYLSELMKSFYTLKESAELFYRGGSHIISSKHTAGFLKDRNISDRINNILLPKLFSRIDRLLSPAYRDRR